MLGIDKWFQLGLELGYDLTAISNYKLGTVNLLHEYCGNTGCRVFKRGIKNLKDFCLKINIPKGIIEF